MKLPSDNPVRVIECLKSLGLTKYEALVYIALLKLESATASEIHEISGVPRASVYTVVDQLLDKGLVSVSQSAPKRFASFSPEDAISKLMEQIERDAQYARDSLSKIYRERTGQGSSSEELIWNIYGLKISKKDSLIPFPVQIRKSELLLTPSFYHQIFRRNSSPRQIISKLKLSHLTGLKRYQKK